MDNTEIKEKIVVAILDASPDSTASLDADWTIALKEHGIDSLDQMMVLLKIEDQFEGIEIAEADAANIKTLNDIFELVNGKL